VVLGRRNSRRVEKYEGVGHDTKLCLKKHGASCIQARGEIQRRPQGEKRGSRPLKDLGEYLNHGKGGESRLKRGGGGGGVREGGK